MDYSELLKSGKSIRITHNDFIVDGWKDNSGWKEELWRYDKTLQLFVCYYPISTYESDFHTYHRTENIYAEDATVAVNEDTLIDSEKSLKELYIEKVNYMTDEQLRIFLSV